jgi:acyl-coenzyme A thioesterase PaaI-like protein
MHFVRPILPDGQPVSGEGRAVHIGTNIATAEGRAHDGNGKLVAHATATLAILDPNARA